MLFKQFQLFQLDQSINQDFITTKLEGKLQPLAFEPCLPSMLQSAGWVPPVDQEGNESLVRVFNGYVMICLQIEEKILPSSVIYQSLNEAIKEIETSQDRKIRSKEKMALKDEIVTTLLPRAFSKLTRVYAYIDTANHWLVLGSANPKRAEQFVANFKKAISDDIYPISIKHLSSIMTHWLKNQDYPTSFAIEKAAVLQDPNQENRVIRCKYQDLFAEGIQSFIKDGCHAIQLAMSWQDKVNFILANDFSFSSIQFQDEVLAGLKEVEAETKQQIFDADFFMMTALFSSLLIELMALLQKNISKEKAKLNKINDEAVLAETA